jgi:hypothetical protein
MILPRTARLTLDSVFFLLMCGFAAPAASGAPQPAAVVDDAMVFRFEPNAYKTLTADEGGAVSDLGSLQIDSVAVAGTFNDWDRTAWQMNRMEDGGFELSKPLTAFSDQPYGEFKFVINGKLWAEPPLMVVPGDTGALNYMLPEPADLSGTDRFAWADSATARLKEDEKKVILTQSFIGRGARKFVALTVSRDDWETNPSWSVEDGEEPPLSMSAAIQAARNWLGSKYSSAEDFRLYAVELSRGSHFLLGDGDEEKSWHYMVRFAKEQMADDNDHQEVMVLLGGVVAEPFTLERDSAAASE